MKKYPRRLIKQFFKNTDPNGHKYSKLLLNHLESQSVCDFAVNILMSAETDAEDARKQFATQIIRQLALQHSEREPELFLLKVQEICFRIT